jgi:hypothetical protein
MCAYMLELETEIRLMKTLADYSRHLPRDVANAKANQRYESANLI